MGDPSGIPQILNSQVRKLMDEMIKHGRIGKIGKARRGGTHRRTRAVARKSNASRSAKVAEDLAASGREAGRRGASHAPARSDAHAEPPALAGPRTRRPTLGGGLVLAKGNNIGSGLLGTTEGALRAS